jgi:hypothetical protein
MRPQARLCVVSVIALLAVGCPSSRSGGGSDAGDAGDAGESRVESGVGPGGDRGVRPARGAATSGAAGTPADDRPVYERLHSFYPPTLGGFYRTGVRRYDRDGHDASVGYNYYPDGKFTMIAVTAYFYPAPPGVDSLDEAVDHAMRDVASQHDDLRVTGRARTSATAGGQRHEGRKVMLAFANRFGSGRRTDLNSELHVFRLGERLVKYRITYPAARAAEARERIAAFLEKFPWPSGL